MSTNTCEDDSGRLTELIEVGSGAAGASTGAALALLLGPPGAGVGVIVASFLKRAGLSIHERFTEPRRRMRAGTAYAIAASDIARRLEEGEVPRQDGFFDDEEDSPAEELLEGVLQTAADSFEQRKVPFLGHLYASIVFASKLQPATANRLLRLAEQLTYRQLAFIAVIAEGDQETMAVRQKFVTLKPENRYVFGDELGLEIDELSTCGLIGLREPGDHESIDPRATQSDRMLRSFRSVDIRGAAVTPYGQQLYELMGLHSLALNDREDAFRGLTQIMPGRGV